MFKEGVPAAALLDIRTLFRQSSFFMSKLLADLLHNCRVKIYPDGSRSVLVSSAPIFREKGWEDSDKWEAEFREKNENVSKFVNLQRAKRRAKAAVFDLALSNDFKFFVTLTLDSEKINRYDISVVTKKLNVWLDNNVRRKGLKYILVPEFHKDSAIHFHGFFNDALSVSDSGALSDGGKPKKPRSAKNRAQMIDNGFRVVYNLPAWSLGFTTAIEIYGDRRAACGYVCKYITKANDKVGGRWYYSGGGLALPEIELFDVDFADFVGNPGFSIDALGADVVKFWLERGEELWIK